MSLLTGARSSSLGNSFWTSLTVFGVFCYFHFVIKSRATCRPKSRCQSDLSTVSVLANRSLHQDLMHSGCRGTAAPKVCPQAFSLFPLPSSPLDQRPVHRLDVDAHRGHHLAQCRGIFIKMICFMKTFDLNWVLTRKTTKYIFRVRRLTTSSAVLRRAGIQLVAGIKPTSSRVIHRNIKYWSCQEPSRKLRKWCTSMAVQLDRLKRLNYWGW